MNIIVLLRLAPDPVEELEVDASGIDLNREWLKYKINEFDDHALEEALLLKEETGGTVTAMGMESEEIDKTLFTASAKGADKIIKIRGDFGQTVSSHASAKIFAHALQTLQYDLVLTGVQAVNERDGQVAVLTAHYLGVPHISVVTGVTIDARKATVLKEYAGGVLAEFEVDLPAVLGIQAARQTPRYAPVSRIRQAMRKMPMEEIAAGEMDVQVGSKVEKIFKPASGQGAEMLSGSPKEVADRIVDILKERGIR